MNRHNTVGNTSKLSYISHEESNNKLIKRAKIEFAGKENCILHYAVEGKGKINIMHDNYYCNKEEEEKKNPINFANEFFNAVHLVHNF